MSVPNDSFEVNSFQAMVKKKKKVISSDYALRKLF